MDWGRHGETCEQGLARMAVQRLGRCRDHRLGSLDDRDGEKEVDQREILRQSQGGCAFYEAREEGC